MSIDNTRHYPIVNFGHGTVCLTTVLVEGVPGIAFSYACQQRKVGEHAPNLIQDGEPVDEDKIGVAFAFHNVAGLDNFLLHIDEVRQLLEEHEKVGC